MHSFFVVHIKTKIMVSGLISKTQIYFNNLHD